MSRVNTSPEIHLFIQEQAHELFERHRGAIFRHTDRLFCGLLGFQWLAAICAALWLSPLTWEGTQSETHIHVWAAIFLGGAIISLPILMVAFQPGRSLTRHLVGIAQMLMGALLIHLLGGRIETHFHVFGSLAFLAFYRDWRVLVSASAVVAADHFLRGLFWPRSVYGVLIASEWRWLEHAGWVIFEDLFLIQACVRGVSEMRSIAERQAQLEATRIEIEDKVQQRTSELESLNLAFQATAAEARQSEEKYCHTLNAAADAIIGVDEAGRIIEFNRAAETMLGYARREALGEPISILFPEDLRARHQAGLMQFLQTGERQQIDWQGLELPGVTRAGTRILMEASFCLLEAEGRKYLTAVLRDITQRKQAEEESRRTHEENQRLLASIPSILISLDSLGHVTKWNRAAETILGVSTKDAIGRPLGELAISWNRERLGRCIDECLVHRVASRLNEVAFKRVDREPGSLSLSITPVLDRAGALQGILVLGTDMTEQRNLETQLAQAQKLESIGQLAAGIAHEINTPIQYVGDNMVFLKDAFADFQAVLDQHQHLLQQVKQGALQPTVIDGVEKAISRADLAYLTVEVPQAIQQTLDGIGRVAKIVRAMKEFSHPGSEGKVASDINKLIENTITVAHNEWKYVAEMTTELDPSLPLVPCITGEFNQVILNLIVNAAHAIGDRIANSPGEKGTITIITTSLAHQVEVRVRDTGTGIPEEARSKVFYPFFTTKPVGKGTGQGLAIAHTVIVKKHGGTLTFETETGKGTTFTIRLPMVPDSALLGNASVACQTPTSPNYQLA